MTSDEISWWKIVSKMYPYSERRLRDIFSWWTCTRHSGWITNDSLRRVTHKCIIGSDNGLAPGRCQAIIWTNAEILINWPLGTNFSEILIEMRLSSAKGQPFCLGLSVLIWQAFLGRISASYLGSQVGDVRGFSNFSLQPCQEIELQRQEPIQNSHFMRAFPSSLAANLRCRLNPCTSPPPWPPPPTPDQRPYIACACALS